MDLGGVDVWGQIAVETSQMFVSEGGVVKSRFAGTVSNESRGRSVEVGEKLGKNSRKNSRTSFPMV